MTKIQKIIISVITVLILLGFYIYFDKKSKIEGDNYTNQTATTTGQIASTTITNINGTQNTEGNVSYTIEKVPTTKNSGIPKPIPDLNRPVVSTDSVTVSAETIVRATEKILSLQTQLKKNPADFPAWLDLAMYQKMAGDYQGSIISWTYAGILAPSNSVSFGNLGNLYAYYLHDKTKAEIYYKQAISKDPTQAYLYGQLAEVYRDILNDITKAKIIIDQGLFKLPNDPYLLEFKAELNK